MSIQTKFKIRFKKWCDHHLLATDRQKDKKAKQLWEHLKMLEVRGVG